MIVAQKWKDIDPDKHNPIANLDQDYLKFIDTSVFNEEARHFLKYGYYISEDATDIEYDEYWDEQERRCKYGYEVGGIRITGRHYFYLNFCQIKMLPTDPDTGLEIAKRKILSFPRFVDHNYYIFHEIEKNSLEGPYADLSEDELKERGLKKQGMIILKSRRKGLSYMNAGGMIAYNFNFMFESMNHIYAYEKGHYKPILDAVHMTLNHINKHTAWRKRRDVVNQKDNFKASFWAYTDDNTKYEEGYKSEVQAMSFGDGAFKSIGHSCDLVIFEEAGKFSNLIQSYQISQPTFMDGDYVIGTPIIFGTGGDVDKGGADLAEMFYRPGPYGLAEYDNIYDENADGTKCGLFIDDLWYKPSKAVTVDAQGNSHREKVLEKIIKPERLIKKGSSKNAYISYITQYPLNPAEALMRKSGSVFDAARCNNRLSQLKSNKKLMAGTFKGRIDIINGEPHFIHVPDAHVITRYPLKPEEKENPPHGTIQVFEKPVKGSLKGRYIAGIDTYDDDKSSTTSLGSILVLDRLTQRIVCEFTGRPKANKFYEICRRILLYYDAVANYERNKKGLYTYFYNKNCTHLLCDEPRTLKEKSISKANTVGNNSKGTMATTAVNNYGIELSQLWSEQAAYGEENEDIVNIDKMMGIAHLEEMVKWNPDVNADRVSAMIMLMIYNEDRKKIKVENETNDSLANDPYFANIGNKNKQSFGHGFGYRGGAMTKRF